MPVTIYEVAVKAAVSPSTVSRAFTVPDLVRDDTLQRVLDAARDLGYHPNRAARALITGKTGNIGVVVPDISNPFFAAMLKGSSARARESGHVLFLADTEEDTALEESLVTAIAKQVDGLVLCSPRLPGPRLLDLLGQVPAVLVNRTSGDTPAVVMDSADGARQAVEHLAALGHRRIAYLSGPDTSWSNADRRRGLEAAAEVAGLEVVVLGPFAPAFASGVQAADLVLAHGATATVAYNDLMALGVLSRLAVRGVRVPDDVSVIGCDDITMAAMATPPLTTIAMPTEAAGRAAIDLLLRVLQDPASATAAGRRALPTQLLIRSSTLPPPGGVSTLPPPGGVSTLPPPGGVSTLPSTGGAHTNGRRTPASALREGN